MTSEATKPAISPAVLDRASFLANAVDGQGKSVARLREAWDKNDVLEPQEVAKLVDENGSFRENWRTQQVVTALALHAGKPVATGPLWLPEPDVKINLSAARYDDIVREQRKPALREPGYRPFCDQELVGAGVFMTVGCGFFTVCCSLTASPWCAFGAIPTSLPLVLALGDCCADWYSHRPAAPTAAGLVRYGDSIGPAGRQHIKKVYDKLIEDGRLVSEGYDLYRLVSFYGVPEAVDAHVSAPERAEALDCLRVVYAEGQRLEKLALADRLRGELASFIQQPAAKTRGDGYQTLPDTDDIAFADSFAEATKIMVSKIALVEAEAEAYGNLLLFSDRPHGIDAANRHDPQLAAKKLSLRRHIDQLKKQTTETQKKAKKPQHHINRVLASHPVIKSLELELSQLDTPEAPPANAMQR